MALKRLPFRDPRTVARDIPGVLDMLFPRLSGGLVASLNRKAFSFEGIEPVSNEMVDQSQLQKAMLFELAVTRAEQILAGKLDPQWEGCIQVAAKRQSRHFDAKIPDGIADSDKSVAEHAAQNLVAMLRSVQEQHSGSQLEASPVIPGMGWIASGAGDFSLGKFLIEVKHTGRNFGAGDFRQVLMYWILKYAEAIEHEVDIWSDCLLLNPRRNSALLINFDTLLHSASASSNRVELCELLRSIVGFDLERR
ncbi:hypothetical protein FQ320_23490 [Oceaniovalibus sp. ACAM 378]|nr:hypothetical protein FQ320_23490 [Oceaniovalibus sp. ACAM 378]